MNLIDHIAYLWLIPVSLQIVLPIIILCGWSLAKLPALLLGNSRPELNTSVVTAS